MDGVKTDHIEIFQYYDQYASARDKGDVDAQERWARQLIWEVARHSIGEELVVYPLLEKNLGERGRAMADTDRAEHQEVKIRLAKIESLQPGSPEYDGLLKEVMDELKKHMDGEENHDLPQLEATLAHADSAKAVASFQRTKNFVPTRSHPSAPNRPPFETLAGLLAAPIDKLKDAFAKFPTEEMKQNL